MSDHSNVNLENSAENSQSDDQKISNENKQAIGALTIKVYERKFLPGNRPIASNNSEEIDELIGYLD